jgi:DNA-binding transcriptional LysR family regulator
MDAARRVVLLEGGMGALWIGLGVLNVGVDGLREAWWVALAAAVATVTVAYTDEHDSLGWSDWRRYAAAVVGVVAVAVAVGAVALATDLVVLTVVSAALAGMGAGLLPYRLVYGVVRPVPESRLDGARERAV